VELLLASRHFEGYTPKVSAFLHAVMRPMSRAQRNALNLVEQAATEASAFAVEKKNK
jgi:hypothetical protein